MALVKTFVSPLLASRRKPILAEPLTLLKECNCTPSNRFLLVLIVSTCHTGMKASWPFGVWGSWVMGRSYGHLVMPHWYLITNLFLHLGLCKGHRWVSIVHAWIIKFVSTLIFAIVNNLLESLNMINLFYRVLLFMFLVVWLHLLMLQIFGAAKINRGMQQKVMLSAINWVICSDRFSRNVKVPIHVLWIVLMIA